MAKLSLAKLERHLYSAADRLRQEGLDAATYKDFIFGMLFLKRCSDVFDAERDQIVGRRVEQGMIKEVAETQYGENADYYDSFFVPERAREAGELERFDRVIANPPFSQNYTRTHMEFPERFRWGWWQMAAGNW